jgi:ABC-2 type transport system permease protein
MLPIWAIIERDLRKYIRNTRLIAVSILLPMIQLVVVGYAVGGQIRNVDVALVDLDGGSGADDLRQKFAAIEANARTFHILLSTTLDRAVQAAREGTVAAAIIIPEDYSRKVSQGNRPELGLVLDNTDPFVSVALTQKMTELVVAVNSPEVDQRRAAQVALEVVEIFPYIEYIQYLVPGSITLAIYVSCVIGGGVLYIDDKIRGFHEGYLVTPVTKLQLLTGMTISGTVKAVFAGTCVTFLGTHIAGVADRLTLETMGLLIGLNSLVAAALISMITLTMVRVRDPMLPRAVFTVLNTLLLFPSGAIYPIYGFPEWLKVVSKVDPFTYAVHGFRGLLLKGVGVQALVGDMIFLTGFSVVCFLGAYVLFPRRL